MMKRIKTTLITYILSALAMTGILNAYDGVNYYEGHKETYYNLSMNRIIQKAEDNGIEGWYWERCDGAKMYGPFIIVAADHSVRPYGSLVSTSLGTGIVLDTGKFVKNDSHQVDIATNW